MCETSTFVYMTPNTWTRGRLVGILRQSTANYGVSNGPVCEISEGNNGKRMPRLYI